MPVAYPLPPPPPQHPVRLRPVGVVPATGTDDFAAAHRRPPGRHSPAVVAVVIMCHQAYACRCSG